MTAFLTDWCQEFFQPRGQILAALLGANVLKFVGLNLVRRSRLQRLEQIGRVGALYIYPIKSCGSMELQFARCTPLGLSNYGISDRIWAVLLANGELVTMKEHPKLTLVTSTDDGDRIKVDAPGMPSLWLPKTMTVDRRKIVKCKLETDVFDTLDCGTEASEWISRYLGREGTRLIFCAPQLEKKDAYNRPRPWENTARKGDVTSFAYLTSYMMTSSASLEQLNSKMDTAVSSLNFRPNIVVDGSEPFDEDTWEEILIGKDAYFHTVEPCLRCTITTIDPSTARKDATHQPLKTLRRFRCHPPYGQSPIFGVYAALDTIGDIKVGDPVYVIRCPVT